MKPVRTQHPNVAGQQAANAAVGVEARRPNLLRPAVLAVALIGFALALPAATASGLADIFAVTRRMGLEGFAAYCLYSLFVFGLLGAGWLVAIGSDRRWLPLFGWARMLRESASDLLPFSQIGGIVIGTRTLMNRGYPAALVHASLVVDLTTEMASQLLFTLFGVGIAASLATGPDALASVGTAIAWCVALIVVVLGVAVSLPQWLPGIGARIATRLLPRSIVAIDAFTAELRAIRARPAQILLSFAINLAAWVASAAGAWLALRLMGVELALVKTLALEASIFALRSVAFAVPGGLGVQEAGYALAAPLFGLPPDSALALALAKRCRDFAIGVPTLVAWQWTEARALVGSARGTDTARTRSVR